MDGDRIETQITLGYKAINSKGLATIEIPPITIIIRDQSPESASAHLAGIVIGALSPAQAQIKQ